MSEEEIDHIDFGFEMKHFKKKEDKAGLGSVKNLNFTVFLPTQRPI